MGVCRRVFYIEQRLLGEGDSLTSARIVRSLDRRRHERVVRIAVSVRRAARPTRAAEKVDVSTPFKNVPPRDQAPVDVTFYLLF